MLIALLDGAGAIVSASAIFSRARRQGGQTMQICLALGESISRLASPSAAFLVVCRLCRLLEGGEREFSILVSICSLLLDNKRQNLLLFLAHVKKDSKTLHKLRNKLGSTHALAL